MAGPQILCGPLLQSSQSALGHKWRSRQAPWFRGASFLTGPGLKGGLSPASQASRPAPIPTYIPTVSREVLLKNKGCS